MTKTSVRALIVFTAFFFGFRLHSFAEGDPIKVVVAAPGKAPSDAIVLFDGSSTDAFVGVDGNVCKWPVKDGVMTVGTGFIVSKLHFRDA